MNDVQAMQLLKKIRYAVQDTNAIPSYVFNEVESVFESVNVDAARLASLTLEYLSGGRLRPTTPPQVVAEMLELAHKIAGEPQPVETRQRVAVDQGVWEKTGYINEYGPERTLVAFDSGGAAWVLNSFVRNLGTIPDSNPHDPAAYRAARFYQHGETGRLLASIEEVGSSWHEISKEQYDAAQEIMQDILNIRNEPDRVYELHDSPAQTGESGHARFVKDGA